MPNETWFKKKLVFGYISEGKILILLLLPNTFLPKTYCLIKTIWLLSSCGFMWEVNCN